MTQRFTTGKVFTNGEQVTAQDLENLVELSTPLTALTDDQTLTVNNGQVIVKDGSSTNGVPLTKMKHIAGHSLVGNTGSATAAPTAIELTANEVLLGNANGDGLITDKIDTDNIKDDAVTQAKTSFINSTTGQQTLTGTSPNLTFDDTNNVVANKPFINGNTTDGGIHVRAQEANSVIQNLGTGKVLLATSNTPGSDVTDVSQFVNRLEVSSTSGKDLSDAASAGAKVTGDLQVTGNINAAGGAKIAGDVTITDPSPRLTFNDTTVSNTSPFIEGSNDGHLVLYTRESGSDINLDPEHEVIMKSNNGGTVVFRASDASSKDSQGNASQQGIKVEGNIWATGDMFVEGGFSDIKLKSASPKIEFEDTDASVSNSYIQSFNSGNIEIKTEQADSLVRLDGKKGILIEYDGSNTLLEANATAAKDAGGNANQVGIKVHGDIYATGDISADGDVVASLSSDKRLKDNIAPIQDATSKVNKLSGNTFDWNDKSKYSGSDVGVIAQEVQEIIPSAVKETEEGYLKVEYTKIVPLLIESIKELSAKVQELEAKVK
tara:strand:- start:624 stop:2267 length:1644 start_codon:yes stop_codon:yes gene_type:complete